jgi:hypothetical protein
LPPKFELAEGYMLRPEKLEAAFAVLDFCGGLTLGHLRRLSSKAEVENPPACLWLAKPLSL